MKKKIIAGFAYKDGEAVYFDKNFTPVGINMPDLCLNTVNHGADGILITDFSKSDEEHELFMGIIRSCARVTEIPIIIGGRVKRLEDVKKYLYAGASKIYLDMSDNTNTELIEEASKRFGKDKIWIYINNNCQLPYVREYLSKGATGIIVDTDFVTDFNDEYGVECLYTIDNNYDNMKRALDKSSCSAVMIMINSDDVDYMSIKDKLKSDGISVLSLDTDIRWEDVKKGCDGLLTVVVQDYRTQEVLMTAYMDEEAWNMTLKTGKMTYHSRSRNELWIKGDTSGHYQYVKSLTLDCDNDTLLAKVFQVGAACHTGSHSCFFNTVASKNDIEKNPLTIFEDVYNIIIDRKENPKEGSYTNYLFDKGIDKILKKVGEEATEIVIAAKNPDPEEIKYEISDFLYHVMVLMAERGVTWDDICKELADR